MKVCQFISYSADSEYTRNLGLGLASRGVEQLWVTLFDKGAEVPDWIKSRAEIDYICLNARSRFDFPLSTLKLAGFLTRKRIDIIQTHLYEASLVGLLAAKLSRTSVSIMTRHHLDQALLIGKKLPVAIDRWETKAADHIVTLGKAVRDHLVVVEGVRDEKISVVHQGFDFQRFSATETERDDVRRKLGFRPDDIVIGTFGNFFPTKGHRYLLVAVKELIDRYPSIRLLFVGAGGDQEEVTELVRTLDLQEKVVFAGFRKDVPACMKACEMVVHPSLSEAFCQVLIESMSVGTPLISTDVGGAREVIETDVNGILVPPADPPAIVRAIISILDSPDRARQMAEAGQKSVREQFTIDKMIDKQYSLYVELLGHS